MDFNKNPLKRTSLEDSSYPELLKEIADPPKDIYSIGVIPKKGEVFVSVVGTRKASSEGCRLAKQCAAEIVKNNIGVVSGLALGIDAAAHQGALQASGRTIAVLACGLDNVYPKQNEALAKTLIDFGGAILSEYPENTPPLPYRFLERNRIVSGLSTATIVIEAPEQSGALVTARLAAEQGRDVFVFPGPVGHPNYRGSHSLIRDGARLVSSAADILEDLGFQSSGSKLPIFIPKNEDERLIHDCLQGTGRPTRVDKIIEITNLEPKAVQRTIVILMMEGAIKETEGGYVI